jgi:hypothetical protein
MLDRATIERLSRTPEKNAPMLNVALAEEGTASVLVSLARSHAVGPEALAVIGERIDQEGTEVGFDREAPPEEFVSVAADLDRLLIAHPNAADRVRDAVLGRHPRDAFFVLAAACHPRATLSAVERAVDWPAASKVHDRLWLPLIEPGAVPPLTLEEWSQDSAVHRREAAARIGRAEAMMAILGRDRSRQVRRAVASNRLATIERARLAAEDPAPEVRARAAVALTAHGDPAPESAAMVDTARFAASLRAMKTGGVLAPDVVRALSSNAADLDDEGAFLAGQVLPRTELLGLLEQLIDLGVETARALSFAAGLALRPLVPQGAVEELDEEAAAELTEIVYDAVKSLSRTTTADSRLTGKARLAAWAAAGMARCEGIDRERLLHDLSRRPIGGERMILARSVALRPSMIGELCQGARSIEVVPSSLLELAWADTSVPEEIVIELAGRIAKPRKRAEDLPEDEVDLDPSLRPLGVLEKVVLGTTTRANVSPRAALATVALDARRVRYVLSAMPQWKGRLTGGRLARVFRQHAGALTVAQAETRARSARIEPWTERLLSELELAVALAVGHLTGTEVARRIQIGRQTVDEGLTLASGAEARAALEGPAAIQPIVEWAGKHRTSHPAALAVWLLLEKFERERVSTLIASSIDSVSSGKGVVPPCVCDALSAIEHRRPGRLEGIHPQSPRGRATLASALARAYRAIGGMRDERQGP